MLKWFKAGANYYRFSDCVNKPKRKVGYGVYLCPHYQ